MIPNYRASIEFLQAFRPAGYWVLTAIKPDKKSIETRSFATAEVDDALAWLESRGQDHNIYFSVNPTLKPVRKKAEREDIAALAFLHVDIDPRPGQELEVERARALELLTERLPESVPPPTWVIDSGGGYHAYWTLDEPMPIEGSSSKYEEAKRYNQQLEILVRRRCVPQRGPHHAAAGHDQPPRREQDRQGPQRPARGGRRPRR